MKNNSTILITGGSGMIGERLSELLISKGYQVNIFSRNCSNKNSHHCFNWDPNNGDYDKRAIENVNTIINLAGAGIADKAWTSERKKLIIESRTSSIELIQKILRENPHNVKTVLSASAIGYYGDAGKKLVDENSKKGRGFLADSTDDWENASKKFNALDVRNVIFRIGIVLSDKGGAFKELTQTLPFRFLTILGKGDQYMSWIHLDDICRSFIHSIENTDVKGTYNITTETPVTNKELNQVIKKHNKHFTVLLSVPKFILNLILGERASVVLNSSNVSSQKFRETGFRLKYDSIDSCVINLLNGKA
ncbi:MAG: TIGR01777 family protein [Bacteroidia bacterium]|nr:TIGR01777 family protein [Bacteroidia bacterium]